MPSFKQTALIAGFIIASVGLTTSALATSNYAYKHDEYALIEGGQSPDGRLSVRAHGEGELGDENFHLYLFHENPRKRIGALEEIVPLDTSPGSFKIKWTTDSHAAVIDFRSDRRVVEAIAYVFANNRAYQITRPSLIEAATHINPAEIADQQTASDAVWTWTSPTRFKLKVTQTYKDEAGKLQKTFGKFGGNNSDVDGGLTLIDFSATAECELVGQNGYRILSIQP